MTEEPEIIAGVPEDFTESEREVFCKLVRRGDEISGAVLEGNVANAKALVILRRAGQIQGTAALKRPQSSYRKRIASKAGTDIAPDRYPYELGYVFLIPEAQGKKLSHVLVAAALDCVNGAGVFATTRTDNAAMLASLTKAGFKTIGEPYAGRGTRRIQLLVRAIK